MNHYLQYWKHHSDDQQIVLDHTASDQLGKVHPGDIIWVITIKARRLYLLGPIVTLQVVSQREAERRLGTKDLWRAVFHVIARPSTIVKGRLLDLTPVAARLRFIGRVTRLPQGFTGRSFQKIRRLTPESVLLIEQHWKHSAGRPLRRQSRSHSRHTASDRSGGGFAPSEQGRQVEQAALHFVIGCYRASGWRVRNISKLNKGYDLECSRGSRVLHIEVKGSSGQDIQFVITPNEKAEWANDPNYVLAFVANALSKPFLRRFEGQSEAKLFEFVPLSYVARLRQKPS